MKTLCHSFAWAILFALVSFAEVRAELRLTPSAERVGCFERIDFALEPGRAYAKPFDPDEVDMRVVFQAPGGRTIELPAFFGQPYQRETLGEGPEAKTWLYPAGAARWQARFAPMEAGPYEAVAVLRDSQGEERSAPVRFTCTSSDRHGFLRVSRSDSRYFEYSDGTPFFPIGQNLAFIGEGQYVTLARAESIFGKLHAAGANYLRVWTCCEDWAMAIEARKSAWGRSWDWRPPLVSVASGPPDRRYVQLDAQRRSVEISPSHRVALRPGTAYRFTARVQTAGDAALQVQIDRHALASPVRSAAGSMADVQLDFTTASDQRWLGRTMLELQGEGTALVDGVALREATGGFNLLWEADPNRPVRGFYNPVDCAMLDELLAAAEKNGLHLQLTLLTRDLYMESLADPASPAYGQAVADACKTLRYAVARWGYSTSVACWEYFNEMNPGLPTDRFYREVGEYLERIDPYRHLRGTSTWGPSPKDHRHEKLDVADVHFYLRPEDRDRLAHEVAAAVDRARYLRQNAPAKPALIGEFGIANAQWQPTAEMKTSREIVDFHNALWASALSGASGTALFWWWDRLDPRNHTPHFRALADFLEGVPWTTARLQPMPPLPEEATVQRVGLQGTDRAYFWLFNPEASWQKVVVEARPPSRRGEVRVSLSGLAPGTYRVAWWDTIAGKPLGTQLVRTEDGTLELQAPAFDRDIACKVVLPQETPAGAAREVAAPASLSRRNQTYGSE